MTTVDAAARTRCAWRS